jgi:hypothetical protein
VVPAYAGCFGIIEEELHSVYGKIQRQSAGPVAAARGDNAEYRVVPAYAGRFGIIEEELHSVYGKIQQQPLDP